MRSGIIHFWEDFSRRPSAAPLFYIQLAGGRSTLAQFHSYSPENYFSNPLTQPLGPFIA